jgi:hypothetical protein
MLVVGAVANYIRAVTVLRAVLVVAVTVMALVALQIPAVGVVEEGSRAVPVVRAALG